MPARGEFTMAPTRRKMMGGLAAAAGLASGLGPLAGRAGAQPGPAADPPPFGTASRQFTLLRPARPLPALRLIGLDGRASELASFRGQVVLLNFWATWCPACRNELPSLEHAQEAHRGLKVLAVSVDRERPDRVKAYVERLKLRRVAVFADPEARVAFSDRDNPHKAPFALYGMPITYVVDRAGRVRGYMPGEGDWTSPQAARLLRHFLDGG